MNKVIVRVDGEEKLVASMGRVARDARARVKRTMTMLGIMLTSHIQKTKLSGQRLHQRTGRLSGSIHEETEENGDFITTTVGTNVKYARPHEFGFTDPVTVKAHLRTIKQAWGKPIPPRSVHVRAHPMKMNIGEKRFMRDSLSEFRPKAEARLAKLAQELAQEVTTR